MAIEGLQIRRAEPDDCDAVYEMFTSPQVYVGTLQLPYPSREYWRKRIAEGEGCYYLVAVSGEHVIGMVSVDTFPHIPRRRHAGHIGISVAEAWQGKGVGNALMHAGIDLADKWLNLTRLELEVYADNEAAIRLYERFGFEHEGVLRRHAFRNGEYVDAIMMARLR
ncbi:MAG TPA: GNAT family N-acetyltransferase [Pyrinomonadaceae bacterium]|nr:GNAT family N-acetyltransferase [Pyrinomonadaceae bacterium]